jgi:Xaa-Pro aminopeptidase
MQKKPTQNTTYEARLSEVKEILRSKRCSHILVTSTVDCEYLSGFHASNVFLLVSKSENLLFTDFRYKDVAEAFCRKNPSWRFILAVENGISLITSFVGAGSVVGIQSNSMAVDEFDRLKRRLKNVRLAKLGEAVSTLFIAKSNAEIRRMAQAARIGDIALKHTLKKLKAGISEREVAFILENECREAGSEKPSFDTIILFGKRAALPHGRPSDARLRRGDFILFDFGCTVDGFASDMTRTVVGGAASDRQKALYRIVAEAQSKAREAVRGNALASEIDTAARRVIEDAGYGPFFGHATGHGIGRLVHERPRIARAVNLPLPIGAVITIEPGIYIPHFGGIRIEDMVVVRSTGGETLTASPRHLQEIDL